MNKLVVLALAGVVGVSGQASGTEASPAPTAAVPTVTPSTAPLQPTATPGTPSDFYAGIPADFGVGIVNPSTLPMKPLPIAAGTTPVLSRAGTVVSPMTSTSILPRTGAISPLSLQAQFGLQSVAANLQAQIQAMNGNINGQLFFGTPTITTSYLPPVYNSGIKGPFGVATPVASPMVASPMAASPMMSEPSAGYNPYSAFPVQSASGPLRVSAPAYGTPTITSSNIASVNAAIAGVSGVPGVGAPVSGLPPGATNLGPSSLIPGAFISGIKYGAAY